MNREKASKDEFYTQLKDIEKEMAHYQDLFYGKAIYCNCDQIDSNFHEYFMENFDVLGLKAITVSCIDFRSDESIATLKEADIIITNPPFSLFREYINQLITYKKKFIILANTAAIGYRDIFQLIQDGKIWLGHKSVNEDMLFDVPESFAKELVLNKKEGSGYKVIDGKVKGRAQSVWFTNLKCAKRFKDIPLTHEYSPERYPKYDNCDAINVNRVKEIPLDYYGVMGVPITFMDKFNPNQFKIVRFRKGDDGKDLSVNGKYTFTRILIQRKIK